MSDLHPTEVPALVDALEAKIAAEPRSERNVALDEAIDVIYGLRRDHPGIHEGRIRVALGDAILGINALREA